MISIINKIIEGLGDIMNAVLMLLPSSPFVFVDGLEDNIVAGLNWLFPISSMIAHLELFVLAVAAYYVIRVVLKWTKAAGD